MNKDFLFNVMSEFEKYSYNQISQISDWHSNNSDIRWHANCVDYFEDENITNYYLNDEYARKTRWNLWNGVVDIFLKHKIKSNLDIGCATNHFSFLCNKKEIFSVGIDPRENCLRGSEEIFKRNFENQKYGYVGNIKTFGDFFDEYNEPLFDCVSILNFLHGNDHQSLEIKKLFDTLPKISRYVIITEPKWIELKLPKITDNYEVVEKINNSLIDHVLYKIGD